MPLREGTVSDRPRPVTPQTGSGGSIGRNALARKCGQILTASRAPWVLCRFIKKDLSRFDGLNYDPQPMTRLTLSGLVGTVLVWQLTGCATQSDVQTKQLNELKEQVRRLQATSDRLQERLSALENQAVQDGQESQRPLPVVTPGVPELPVVKMSPEPKPPTADPSAYTGESEEPRPLIVGEGSRIETRTSNGEAATSNATVRRSKEKPGDAPGKRTNSAAESGKK